MYPYRTDNIIISLIQSGFQQGDSCTNQVLWILDEMLNSCDEEFKVIRVFIDISKPFDKVWDKTPILKLVINETLHKVTVSLAKSLDIPKKQSYSKS